MSKVREAMDNSTLQKVQGELLIIAKEIRRVCDENGINYFLCGGTLIGAVRHKGFIPWDDDLDMGMLREDFDRFCKIAPEKLSKDFFLQTWDTDKEYGHAYAKVRMNGTKYREMADSTNKKHQGFYVDILPYDNIPEDKDELAVMSGKIMTLRYLMIMKNRMTVWKVHTTFKKRFRMYLSYLPKRIKAAFISRDKLIADFNSAMRQYNGTKTPCVCQESGGATFGKYPIKREFLESFTDLEFEGEAFKCPAEYDRFLRDIYGDYMQLPPEEERVCRHGIFEIKFKEEH